MDDLINTDSSERKLKVRRLKNTLVSDPSSGHDTPLMSLSVEQSAREERDVTGV